MTKTERPQTEKCERCGQPVFMDPGDLFTRHETPTPECRTSGETAEHDYLNDEADR